VAVRCTQVDVGDARRVSWEQGSEFARRHGCLFVETSAKTNVAVANAFEELVLKVRRGGGVVLVGLL
jgi:Ras-related protein Rab-18